MGILQKLIGWLKGERSQSSQEVQTVESIILRLYQSRGKSISLKKHQSEHFLKSFSSWQFGTAFNVLTSKGGNEIYCLKKTSKKEEGDLESHVPSPPLFESLFLLESVGEQSEYVLPFSCRIPFAFSQDNRRDLLFSIESCQIYEVTERDSDESSFLMIGKHRVSEVNRRLKESEVFRKAVDQLVLGKNEERRSKDFLRVKIERPDDFIAGRFFLPRIVARKPHLTETRLQDIYLSHDKELFSQWEGLCFKIQYRINARDFTYYYLFDCVNRDNQAFYQKLFTRFLKITFQKAASHFKDCGMKVEKIKARLVNYPDPEITADSIHLNYYMTSEQSMVHGRVLIPMDLISYILAKIAPPWSIVFTTDSLLNRLKSFLSLNRELYSQGRIGLAETFSLNLEVHSDNPILDLKENFLKLHELLDLLSPSEARSLLTDYLYRKGWSARKLKRIFYFTTKIDYSDEPGRILPLSLFHEDRFTSYLMNNMLDEWQHSNDLGFVKEKEAQLKHFHLLRDLYEDRTYGKTLKLQTILEECFTQYYDAVEQIFESVKADDSYTSYSSWHRKSLQYVFEDIRKVKLAFYYSPDHLQKFSSVLTAGKIDDINNVEMDPPERLDDWMVRVFHFRNAIKNVTKNSKEELYIK